jgi:hypothetical protein
MTASAAYEALVERGCVCGTDRSPECSLHGPGDNRGLTAFFRAGMPLGFPFSARCAICPRCSSAAAERALVREVVGSGLHQLNGRRVFGMAAGSGA